MRKVILIIGLVCCVAGISCRKVVFHDNELVLRLDPQQADGAKRMKVVFLGDKIVRVVVSPTENFATDTSLMVLRSAYKPVKTKFWRLKDTLYLSSASLTVRILLPAGKVSFIDSTGKVLLSEYNRSSKKFEPITIESKNFYSIHQIFDSPIYNPQIKLYKKFKTKCTKIIITDSRLCYYG
ncbi:MAG: hypothetical protein ACP5PS_10825 [Bacteroidales bacterium]